MFLSIALPITTSKKIPLSSSSKYSGLAGTLLLGTLLGLNYTQYARRKSPLSEKGGAFDPANEGKPGSFFDRDGKHVPLGATNLPGKSFVQNIKSSIPDISLLWVCAALSAIWSVRALASMNRVLDRRYKDMVYQIRRPDVIRERLVAWKYLGLGGLCVPVVASAIFAFYPIPDIKRSAYHQSALASLADHSIRLGNLSPLRLKRSEFSESVSEFSKTLRSGFRPGI